jgi:stage V sporulation protein SpoVS
MRVLVFSLLSSVLEDALTRDAIASGGPLPVVCMPEPAAAIRRDTDPDHLYDLVTVPSLHDLGALRELAARWEDRVDAVATTNECALQAAAITRGYLGVAGMDLDTAVRFTDKHVMKTRLLAAGVPAAAHRRVHQPDDVAAAAEELGWPVVVKHREGFNATNTHVLRSLAALDRLRNSGAFTVGPAVHPAIAAEVVGTGLATTAGGFLVEEFVDVAAEYHCEILRIDGATVYAIAGRYVWPCIEEKYVGLSGGVLLDPDGDEAVEVRRLALAAADALGLPDGTGHAEVFRTRDGRWLLGEIAARPGGFGIQPAIAHAYTGIDLPQILAALARLERPTVRPQLTSGGFGWVTALSRPELLQNIADPAELMADPRVLSADITQQPGTVGDAGDLPIGNLCLYGADPDAVAATIRTADALFRTSWTRNLVAA